MWSGWSHGSDMTPKKRNGSSSSGRQAGWQSPGDKKIRTRPGERRALVEHNVGCFYLYQKQPLTRWDYLKLLALTLDEMERIFAEKQRPFLYGVSRIGNFVEIIAPPAAAPPFSE